MFTGGFNGPWKKTLYIMHNIKEIKNILLVDVTVRFKALGKQ